MPATARPARKPAAVALVVGGVLVGGIFWPEPEPEPPTPDPQPVNRFAYDLPEGQLFRNTGRPVIAVSPDGRQFVYNATGGFYLRTMDELEARLIPGTEPALTSPVFSPDGQAVAYYDIDANELKRSAISGGAAVVIGPVASNVHGLSWGADGTILIGQPEGILRVAATGGTTELIIPTEDGTQVYGPRLLPDGDSVLFSVGPPDDWDAAQIVVESLSTGERKVLVEGGNDARYLPTGHLVYAFEEGLFAVAFDLDNLTVSGGVVPLVQGVLRAGNRTGAANYGVSENGTLVYLPGGGADEPRTLVWVDREGREEAIPAEPSAYGHPHISPDGMRVALDDRREGGSYLWVWDFVSETCSEFVHPNIHSLSPFA